jgi:hypothetical protein
MKRYILQPSEKPNHWVCTDQENKIVCVFEDHKFNETQKTEMLEDFNPDNFMKLARYMREMGDWLRDNHHEKIF